MGHIQMSPIPKKRILYISDVWDVGYHITVVIVYFIHLSLCFFFIIIIFFMGTEEEIFTVLIEISNERFRSGKLPASRSFSLSDYDSNFMLQTQG